jgi:gamma-glutamylputrescine oxidase
MPKKTDSVTINFNYSFWETQTFFSNINLVVVGSGIVGLSSAISYKIKHPKAKVVVLEMGVLPTGASTKNAGFACFGSVSELLADIKKTNEAIVLETVDLRLKKTRGEGLRLSKPWWLRVV